MTSELIIKLTGLRWRRLRSVATAAAAAFVVMRFVLSLRDMCCHLLVLLGKEPVIMRS